MITVIANLKGGSGKSTVAFNLAVWLERHGQPVIGYDLDPQCTFSDLAMLRQEIGVKPELAIHSVRAVLKDQLLGHTDMEVLVDVGAANMAAMKEALTAADRILIPVPPSQADVWATQRFLHIVGRLPLSIARIRTSRYVKRMKPRLRCACCQASMWCYRIACAPVPDSDAH
jgi:chromosome partitioning protein